MTFQRKKLIEVSLPLEAINAASAREKSIRHGHPSTLHLWWARRPLAACRAVLFAQIVDDPSSWPEEFPAEEDQVRERERLHGIIKDMVPWKATNNEFILGKARYEIARSIARGRGETPPSRNDSDAVLSYLSERAPPVCDPFCGGGSIPLEAQRLGLRAHGSDLNPVAVLVSKATCEIPPKFANRPPVNPDRDPRVAWKGAAGLAEDIRYYGRWMRDQAKFRIGHLYPKVRITRDIAAERGDLKPYVGKGLTVIAWLWARTVASPDPMMRGKHVPLASSFVLSSKKGREAIVVPEIDREGGSYRFTITAAVKGDEKAGVKASKIPPDELERARAGTKAGRGANFTCLVSGAPIAGDYIKAEGRASRMGACLMAVVAAGNRTRVYLDPTEEMEVVAGSAAPEWKPEATISGSVQYLGIKPYGMHRFDQLFTDRQLVALTALSDLVTSAHLKVLSDARGFVEEDGPTATWQQDTARLADGGTGADAYADAVATYLGLCVSRQANRGSNLSFWDPGGANVQQVFARQALSMVWDFCEANPFSDASGNFVGQVGYLANVVANAPVAAAQAAVIQQDAAEDTLLANDAVIASDPPYYDNVPYADISDFFYVWQRRTLSSILPELFRRVLTPKEEELVAFAYRHANKKAAETYFMDGIGRALQNMHRSSADDFPVTLYYAFRQSEIAKEGLTSPGWATFLQGLVDAEYLIDGTWPMRTELAGNLKKRRNALATSIVLVCRKRPPDAPVINRREFVARLRSTLPVALAKIRAGGVGPVDMAQASIGPGMGVFTAATKVLEPDDTPMTVRTAIALINQIRDEISGEEATGYDADTRFCIDWFETFGMDEGKSSDAITLAQAYDIGIEELEAAGVFDAHGGSVRLLRREELPQDWNPATDSRLTDWECAQHLARTLESPAGGIEAAAKLYANMPSERSEAARMLAYRLYDICERKNRASEAQVWNMLAREWTALETAAVAIEQNVTLGQLL